MEVMVPMAPGKDFRFDSTASSPCVSAPSSPRGFGGNPSYYLYLYASAPASPSRVAALYSRFNDEIPSHGSVKDDGEDEFEFNFSGQLEKGGMPPALMAADELFEAGKIRPLKLSSRLQVSPEQRDGSLSPRSTKSPKSARGRGEGRDPFTVATREATRDRPASARSRRGSRSLSPLRGGGAGDLRKGPPSSTAPPSASTSSSIVTFLKSAGSRKWRLKDLLLFRSASEGRATGRGSKDPLRKYTGLSASPPSSLLSAKKKSRGDESKNSSFRSTESNGSARRPSGPPVSAHEVHYTTNRAASEELRKKTPLPYRQALFGCLRFNPAVNGISRSINSYSLNRGR